MGDRNKGGEGKVFTPKESLAAARKARVEMQRRAPPPSMWSAPQSQIPPPNPADQPTTERANTYFRRVAQPQRMEGILPTKAQRVANVAGGAIGTVICFYLIFLHDFGPREHVFTPLRRFFALDAVNPIAISPEERKWADQRKGDETDKLV